MYAGVPLTEPHYKAKVEECNADSSLELKINDEIEDPNLKKKIKSFPYLAIYSRQIKTKDLIKMPDNAKIYCKCTTTTEPWINKKNIHLFAKWCFIAKRPALFMLKLNIELSKVYDYFYNNDVPIDDQNMINNNNRKKKLNKKSTKSLRRSSRLVLKALVLK